MLNKIFEHKSNYRAYLTSGLFYTYQESLCLTWIFYFWADDWCFNFWYDLDKVINFIEYEDY